MDEIDNKAVVRLFIEKVENTGDVSRIRDFIAEKYTEIYEGERYPIGIQGTVDQVLGVRRVLPDLVLSIEHGGAANMLDPLLKAGAIMIFDK